MREQIFLNKDLDKSFQSWISILSNLKKNAQNVLNTFNYVYFHSSRSFLIDLSNFAYLLNIKWNSEAANKDQVIACILP